MDLQGYLRTRFHGRKVILVGNAPFSCNRADLIDSHDIVIRFNRFAAAWRNAQLNGARIDLWFNNLVRDSATKTWRADHCRIAKRLNPAIIAGTPHEDDKHKRLKCAQEFYAGHGLDFLFPDSGLPIEFLIPKQPSTGFYTAFRLLTAGIRLSVIGFNGQVSRHHDGQKEMEFLRSHPDEVELHLDF